MAAGLPATDRELSTKLKIHYSTISTWRDDVAFVAWFDGFVTRVFHRRFNLLLLRAFHLGLKGSIKHMEFFAKYSGEVDLERVKAANGAGVHEEPGASLPVINVVVPRPPGALPPAPA